MPQTNNQNCNRLTIIIPFLNEGIEVHNTVKSIRETANTDLPIILINDASNDNYDYKSIAKEFNTQYISHAVRKGVAASRDEGINLSETEYFLLLDAHMRFYQNNWVDLLLSELDKDERVLLCCQTKVLYKENNIIIEAKDDLRYGARTVINDNRKVIVTEWIRQERHPNLLIEDTPCVLGAAYSTSKKYWNHLKGLSGLISYGNDEDYISMKVWLEGGKCKLLKEVVVGHIYRKEFPYEFTSSELIYNKMLIIETLFPSLENRLAFKTLRSQLPIDIYKEAYLLFLKNRNQIKELKDLYSSILTDNFDLIKRINSLNSEVTLNNGQIIETVIREVLLQTDLLKFNGLFYGKMGSIILLYHYGVYSNNDIYSNIAGELLEGLICNLELGMSINLANGLCGIAWGIHYLIENDFVSGNIPEILENIDRKIMEWDPSRINDYSLDTGLGGVLFYLLGRLKYEDKNNIVFDDIYLKNLYKGANRILKGELNDSYSIEVALKYITFYTERDNAILGLQSIHDILNEINLGENDIVNLPMTLKNGMIGVGLNLILK
ncbi:glycosyltransferase [Dysgonomonas sp. HDW5A]|uniref:glycosyltransferase n=1 Tax=Dysgonomonas sp. HDW5A TaxID=2714926 RepID=UPI00140D8445|nr:glycosyltransferase [Dysgonomonas sp. HDW5A]QIK61404.1 glycosyltransferase [Dysgonomonas sp. HDW5A]